MSEHEDQEVEVVAVVEGAPSMKIARDALSYFLVGLNGSLEANGMGVRFAVAAVRSPSPVPMARCPGCGDRGDVHHVVACVGMKLQRGAEVFRAGWKRGAADLVEMAELQVRRRGSTDVRRLGRAARAMRGHRRGGR